MGPRKTHQWYPIRCCCQPDKIFGFLQLDSHPEWDEFEVTDCDGKNHVIKMKTFTRVATPLYRYDDMMGSDITMPVIHEYAIYSDDRPIEFWRSVVGFVEATQE